MGFRNEIEDLPLCDEELAALMESSKYDAYRHQQFDEIAKTLHFKFFRKKIDWSVVVLPAEQDADGNVESPALTLEDLAALGDFHEAEGFQWKKPCISTLAQQINEETISSLKCLYGQFLDSMLAKLALAEFASASGLQRVEEIDVLLSRSKEDVEASTADIQSAQKLKITYRLGAALRALLFAPAFPSLRPA